MKKLFSKFNKFQIIVLAGLAILVVGLGLYSKLSARVGNLGPKDLKVYADEIVKTCGATDKPSSSQRCYDEHVPKLLDKISMEQAFDVIKIIQDSNGGYWFCHAAGHNISAQEYRRDPSKWKDVMTRCPTGICSNGCIHGALQEHFSAESLNGTQIHELMPDLNGICEKRSNWNPTKQEQSSCYHELGHLSLYLTNSNVVQAAEICDKIGKRLDGRDYLQTCHEGIFMQIFEPREPEDFALIYSLVPLKEKLPACEKFTTGVEKGACWKIGWQEKTESFCRSFSGDLIGACFREAWVVNDDKIETADGIMDYCSYSSDTAEKRKCYNKLFYALMSKFEFDDQRVIKICVSLTDADVKGQCFANTASRMIETDKRLIDRSVSICKQAEAYGVEGKCYDELIFYSTFVFKRGSNETSQLCNLFPNPWKERCLSYKN
ncbi:MAG TPA: hypothetical protein VGQ87_00845 [Patescibacteria group bacterium]|jgi:hypothetical protein|nr:hypothetical protein [Patescibacteria group bacterium]